MALEYVFSEKGKRKLVLRGYLSVHDKTIDGKVYWKCQEFAKKKCRARTITEGESLKKEPSEHNHSGDAAAVEASTIRGRMKEAALNTRDTPHFIVSSLSQEVSAAVAPTLPKISSLKRTIRNQRGKNSNGPAVPQSAQELVFPENYKNTLKGEPFLMFDSSEHPGLEENRLVIFSTEGNLKLLGQSEHWYMDGTFKTVPHLFYQLYTVHCVKQNTSIPLVYALLSNKATGSYIKMLQALKGLEHRLNPQTVMIDYEAAMHTALSTEFPNTTVRGCFFHFCQCMYRKTQSSGLKMRYDTDADFSLRLRYLSALAFVPRDKVIIAFNQLHEDGQIPEEAQEVIDYFEDTWIGTIRRNRRRPPLFSVDTWNCYDGVLQGLPKTNNSIEGWHVAFENQISATHPTIWKFIEGLQREQSLSELRLEQILAGETIEPARKKYRDCADRLWRIVSNYDDDTELITYLRSVAHNLHY